MTDLNDTDRVRVVAELIHDAVTDNLHQLGGGPVAVTLLDSEQVMFTFADGRAVIAQVKISAPVT